MARLVDGWEAWRISTVCAACGRLILACDKAYVEGGRVYHASCYSGGGSASTLADAIDELLRRIHEVDIILDGEWWRRLERLSVRPEVIKMLEELAKTLPREGEGLSEHLERFLKEGRVGGTIR